MKCVSLAALGLLVSTGALGNPATTVQYPSLGTITVEAPSGAPRSVVLFLSGDGGWNQGVVDMAHHLNEEGALVAGIDVRAVQRAAASSSSACTSLAGPLEGLSHHLQQTYGLREYVVPVLVGYSSGATLAYAALAQAPAGTFKGAISLGFCPDLEWTRPLCRGEGLEHSPLAKGFLYSPTRRLQEPWIALQGQQDQVCAASQTEAFVSRVPGARLVSLPAVGHGYSVERNWLPQFRAAFHSVADAPLPGRAPDADVADLPLVELPVAPTRRSTLAIMLSGDGGWAGLDKAVAAELNARGVPVVGWDSLRYFWQARTPDAAARDLARVIDHYTGAWGKTRVLLVGYSQGADVLPFMVNRLPSAERTRVAGTALIAVSQEAFFKFSVTHWISTPTGGLPVAPEVEQGQLGRFACIYGRDEDDAACRRFRADGMRKIELPGGHHFDGDYARVADAVLDGLETRG